MRFDEKIRASSLHRIDNPERYPGGGAFSRNVLQQVLGNALSHPWAALSYSRPRLSNWRSRRVTCEMDEWQGRTDSPQERARYFQIECWPTAVSWLLV